MRDGSNCWSHVGKLGNRQDLSLGGDVLELSSCVGNVGTPIHELMHAIGKE